MLTNQENIAKGQTIIFCTPYAIPLCRVSLQLARHVVELATDLQCFRLLLLLLAKGAIVLESTFIHFGSIS